jgi:hypothetical protein
LIKDYLILRALQHQHGVDRLDCFCGGILPQDRSLGMYAWFLSSWAATGRLWLSGNAVVGSSCIAVEHLRCANIADRALSFT